MYIERCNIAQEWKQQIIWQLLYNVVNQNDLKESIHIQVYNDLISTPNINIDTIPELLINQLTN